MTSPCGDSCFPRLFREFQFQDIVQLSHIHTQSLAVFTPIARTDYRDLPSFEPLNAKGEMTGPDRFSHTDGFVFSHIAVTPTPSWGYITAVS